VEISDDLLSEESELYTHYQWKVDPGQELVRIDIFLTNRLQNASRNRIQNAAKAGCILVNGKAVKPNYRVKPQDDIAIVLPEPPRDTAIHPEPIPLDIVYEDTHLLLVNKPAGLVVHPGYNHYTGTLVHGLAYHFDQLPGIKEGVRPGLVHRIDKDTSGLLVVAKTEDALTHLAKQFFDHSIDRTYLALVWGDMENDKGTLHFRLARDAKDRRIMSVTHDLTAGKHAITHYTVVERFHFMTLIQCQLETGRTHQIRAHMKHIGHPLFSDSMYGGDKQVKGSHFSKFESFIHNCFTLMPRQALHALSLGFIHPVSGRKLYYETPIPNDFHELLQKIRHYVKHQMV
jgi:23S rRNA pseudouridine1911/1915/1917 synthase